MNNYTTVTADLLQPINKAILMLPNHLDGFINTRTIEEYSDNGNASLIFEGTIEHNEQDRYCPKCNGYMHIHSNKQKNSTFSPC